MRIGERLHRDGLIAAEDLATALADQPIAGRRLCSLLIVRGVLDPDAAAKSLAEQLGVAAALIKHLDNRDQSLTMLVPANIARQHYVLPIGRMRDGEIVICVRDPKPETQAIFERILHKPVLVTVAAAHTLEPLIEATYPPVITQDFGMRFARSGNVPEPPTPQSFAAGTIRTQPGDVEDEFDIDIDMDTSSAATMSPETFALVDLDDAGVDKTYSRHDTKTPTTLPPGVGAAPRSATLPPQNVTRAPAKK